MKELVIKPCPSYPDYFADNFGNIYSMKRPRYCSPKPLSPRLLNGSFNKVKKKWIVTLYINNRPCGKFVSELVLDAFVSPRPVGCVVRHGILGSMVDTPENLCWGTQKENIADKKRDGTYPNGEKNPNYKLKTEQVLEIRGIYANKTLSLNKIAKKFNVSLTAITYIVYRKTWKHI